MPPADTPPDPAAASAPSGPDARRPAWLRILPLVLLVAASLVALVSGATHLLDTDRLMASRAWLHEAVAQDRPRAILVAGLVYVGCVVLSLPTSVLLAITYGFLFGTLTGALLAVGSATTGAAIVFSIGAYAARDLVTRRVGSRLGRLAAGFRADAFGYIAVLRLLPLFPFWVTNLAPAAFGVRPRTFVLATLVGLTPGAFVYAAAGSGLEDLVAAHQAARDACVGKGGGGCDTPLQLRRLVTPGTVGGLGALAALALGSIVLRRRFARGENRE